MDNPGVYILECDNGRFYVGSTNDLDRRLSEHNNGKVKATKNIQPVVLKRFIECENLSAARSCEYRLKQYKRQDIIKKVIESGVLPWNYNK